MLKLDSLKVILAPFFIFLFFTVVCSTAFAQIEVGDVINVDFGAVDANDSAWNTFTAEPDGDTTVLDLTEATSGIGTGVGIQVAGTDLQLLAGIQGNGGDNAAAPGSNGSSNPDIFSDHVFALGEPGGDILTITLSGLDDGLLYELSAAYGRTTSNLDNFEQTFAVGSTSFAFENTAGTGFIGGIATFTEIQPANGEIVLTVTELETSDRATLGELTLTAISEVAGAPLLGDINLDGTVDFSDISPFIALLAGNLFQEEGDVDQNGAVDFSDISGFIQILANP